MTNPVERIGLMTRKEDQTAAKFWRTAHIFSETHGDGENVFFEVRTNCNRVMQVFQFRGPPTMYKTGKPRGPGHIKQWASQLDGLCAEVLELYLSKLSGGSLPAFGDLARYPSLTTLTLENGLTGQEIADLAEAIPSLSELRHLDVSVKDEDFDQVIDLGRALQSAGTLETFNFACPLQTDAGKVREFGAIVASIPYLANMKVSGLYYDAADTQHDTLLVELLQSPSLQHLSTSIYFREDATCERAAELLGANTSLLELTFHDDVPLAHLFIRQLKLNHSLNMLFFHANVDRAQELTSSDLMDIFHDNPSIRAFCYRPLHLNFEVNQILERNAHNFSQRSSTLLSLVKNSTSPFAFKRIFPL